MELKANLPVRLALVKSDSGYFTLLLVNRGVHVNDILLDVDLEYLTWQDLVYGNVGFYVTKRDAQGTFTPVEECLAYNTRTRSVLIRRSYLNRVIGNIVKLSDVDYSTLKAQLVNLIDSVSVDLNEGN